MTAKVFIVSLFLDGVKHYFARWVDNPILTEQPEATFSRDVRDAKKFTDEGAAAAVRILFFKLGAQVEILKDGEKLK